MIIRNYNFSNIKSNNRQGGIHPYHEILYVISGQVQLTWMGKNYIASPHSLLLLTPNTPHGVVSLSEESNIWYMELDMEHNNLFPSTDKIKVWNELQFQFQLNSVSVLEHAYTATIQLLTASIYSKNIDKFNISRQLAILDIQKLFVIIRTFVEQERVQMNPSIRNFHSDEAIISLMRFMEARYSSLLSLNEMAKHVHLNPSYLVRIFKSYSGTTPMKYLQTLRMNAATCYLTTTDMSVEEVASLCGFQSIHYFSHFFKQTFGESPSIWRKRVLQEKIN